MLMPLVSLNNEEANDTVTSLLYIYIFVSDFVTTVDVFENFNLRIIKFINFCLIGRRSNVEN